MVSPAEDFEKRIRDSRRTQRIEDLNKKAKRILGKKADKEKESTARIVVFAPKKKKVASSSGLDVIDAPRKGNPFKAKSIFNW